MRQDKIDGRSPLLIRDQDDQPWIALSVWLRGGQIGLWMQVGKSDWKMIQEISTPWKFWTHICADFDTLTGDIALSMDGQPTVRNNFEKLRNGKPTNLDQKLEIGLTDTDNAYGGRRSFRGKISNIQFHVFEETTSLRILSQKPCDTKGSYVAWPDMVFKTNGDDVYELNESESDICAVQPQYYNLVLPAKMTWPEADHLCRAIGGGTMTDIKSELDLETLASEMKQILEYCPSVWLPLSDKQKEGLWKNTNSDLESKFLKWAEGQPNGQRAKNYAALYLENLHFLDYSADATHCTSCTSNTSAFLTLRGLCKDSYLGKEPCHVIHHLRSFQTQPIWLFMMGQPSD